MAIEAVEYSPGLICQPQGVPRAMKIITTIDIRQSILFSDMINGHQGKRENILPAARNKQMAQVYLNCLTILSSPMKKPEGPGSFAVDAHSILILKA